MLNVNQITSRLAKLPDQALKQYAQMHKDDPYTVSLAISESNRRKEIRAGGQQQAQQQPKVADAAIAQMDAPQQNVLPEQQGIGALPAPNMRGMASGGIVAFKEKGKVEAAPDFETALDMEGVRDPVRRAFLKAIYSKETGGGTNTTTSNRGAVGHMQILPETFKSVASPDMKIDNPLDNMRAGIRYASQGYQLAGGDPRLAAAYYYGGPGGLNKAKKGIAVSDPKNPSYPTTLEYGDDVARRMARFKPVTGQIAAAPAVGNSIISSANAGELPQASAQVAPPKQTQVEPKVSLQESLSSQEQMIPTKATVLGVIQSLGKAEAIKRFGVGLVEDSLIGTVGMPADLRKSSATTGVPFLRGLEALTSAMNPNADKDKYTTEDIKRRMTKANLRPEDSPDPNIRAIQTGGEFTGYLTNPIAGVRKLIGGAQKGIAGLKSGVGSWMDELNGVKPVDALADAKAAQAAADAKIAATRLEAPARAAPTSPLVPPLQTQAPPFKVSAEAQAAKEAAAAKAAERAAARATEKPTGIDALAVDKLAAKTAAQRVAVLESAAAREAAGGNAAVKEAAAAKEARNVIASPAEVLTRTTGKDTSNFPTALGGETTEKQAAPVNLPPDIDREKDNLLRRYPVTKREEPAPQQDDMAREIASLQNRYPAPPSSPKEIIKMAKEETPKSAATKGFTSDDWLNLGFNLLAGKSQYAMENLGTAGVATLAAKREREKEERAAALSASINTPEAERVINRLMQEKGIDYASAMKLYFETKNYADVRRYLAELQGATRESVADKQAGAKIDAAEIGAGSKSDKLQQERLALYLEQMEALRNSSAYLLRKSNPVAYNEQVEIINKRFPEFAGQGGGASSVLPNAKILNVRPQ